MAILHTKINNFISPMIPICIISLYRQKKIYDKWLELKSFIMDTLTNQNKKLIKYYQSGRMYVNFCELIIITGIFIGYKNTFGDKVTDGQQKCKSILLVLRDLSIGTIINCIYDLLIPSFVLCLDECDLD